MKLIAALLSVYVFLLAVQPALAVIDLSSKSECCSHCCGHDDEQPATEKKNQDNTCDGVCNPMVSCSSCSGFTHSFQHFSFSPFTDNSERYCIYKVNAASDIELPIWQPPKNS